MNRKTERIAQALNEMRQAARADVAKRCVLHVRIDEPSILELYAVAASKKQPIGTMIREWLLERLEQERSGGTGDKIGDIERRLSALERREGKRQPRRKKA